MQKTRNVSLKMGLGTGAILFGTLFVGTASADITYNTTLASPDTNATYYTNASNNNLSWYNGTGNQNVQGGWTVVTGNGIEVGLRAKLRQSNTVIATGNDVYNVPSGLQPGTNNRAAWNYEYSIDLQPNGVGTYALGDILNNTYLTVTDLTTSQTNTVLLKNMAGDNSGFGTPGGTTCADRLNQSAVAGCGSTATAVQFAAGYGLQNSENPIFGNFPLTGYNPNAADDYQFTLSVGLNGGSVLGSDTIQVDVAPEPFFLLPLAGIGALLVVFARRRRSIA